MESITLRVPVRATMRKVGGEWKIADAEWEDIPADVIAKMIANVYRYFYKEV